MSTNFIKTSKYQNALQVFQLFLSFYMQED